MIRSRIFLGCLMLLAATGCRAQNPSPAEINRRIEVLVRSQFNVPPDYTLALGARSKSDVSGYETLPITFARGPKSSVITFLISSDGKTLARLEKFDLSQDPSSLVSSEGRPVRGNPNAKVTVVNFDDLECPYCARMHEELFPATIERYKDKVRFVYKDFPLTEMHPWAMHAAVDANCLGQQNPTAYWSYVDYLHAHGDEVNGQPRDLSKSASVLDKIAREVGNRAGLEKDKLEACLVKQDESVVRTSMAEGSRLGVDGTPSLFINGEHLAGALPPEQIWMVIDRALVAAGVEPPLPAAPTPAPPPARQ